MRIDFRTAVLRIVLLSNASISVAASTATSQQWDSSSIDTVASGVIHRRLVVNSGPWRINELEINLRQPGISIHAVRAHDAFLGRETMSSMETRYHGPGRAVAGINTGFFNVKTGEDEENLVIEGEMIKGITPSGSSRDAFRTLRSELGLDWKNHPYIERFGLEASLTQGNRSIALNGINSRPRAQNVLVLYTQAEGDSAPVDTTGISALNLPLKLVSYSQGVMTFRVAGPITSGARASLKNGAALVATGIMGDTLRRIARIGGTIRVRATFLPLHQTLRTVVGGWPRIVRSGRSVAEYADFTEGTSRGFSVTRHPRTAAGISKDSSTLYFMTVDGRRESDGGMSLVEVARVMMQLGAYDALNLDGGGSTTMVINGKVVNRPSDPGGERSVASGILVIVGASPPKQ